MADAHTHIRIRERGAHGMRAAVRAVTLSAILGVGKVAAGLFGHSYALVADGMESILDLLSSVVVWSGLRIAVKPADDNHPYGHGKAESLAALIVAVILLGGALLIAAFSVKEILTPHLTPAPWTLGVIVVVVVVKEGLYRFLRRTGDALDSSALVADAWHHRADALTSAAAFVGILIAVIGGEKWAAADDWAALVACTIIVFNGLQVLRSAVAAIMDEAAPDALLTDVRAMAAAVDGVYGIEKCRIRKSGLGWLVDIHVEVDGQLSVASGHDIAHAVKATLLHADRGVHDVLVHIEPHPHPATAD